MQVFLSTQTMACIRKSTVCVVLFALCTIISQVEACHYHSDCSYKYCCERKFPKRNICKSSCIDEPCTFDSDCPPNEYCCGSNDKCATSCVGKSCTYNGDCADDECCDSDGYCKTEDCDIDLEDIGLAGWIVAVIVISVIVVIVIPIAVVVFCCCCAAGAAAASRRPVHGGVVVTQPATTGTTVVASNQQQQLYPAQQGQPMYFQNPQPYPNQPQPYPNQPPTYPNQPPPYQPESTMYPPGISGPPIAMTPQTEVKQ